MIADALRLEIEAHAERVRQRNPFLLKAAAGQVSPVEVERYLVTLHYMIARTHPNLVRARERAREAGLVALEGYYAEKLREETGHDRWAEHDLEVLRRSSGATGRCEPVPAAEELDAFLSATIDRDPVLYLAYVLWAEYFTVLAGGELAQHLVGACDIAPEALTCLVKHVELDKDHTEENLDVLDALVADPQMLDPLRQVLLESMGLFDRLCAQVVEADGPAADRQVASC